MRTVYSSAHTLHNPPHEFFDGALIPTHESPERAEIIRAAVQAAALGPIEPPVEHGLAPVQVVHTPAYLSFLAHAYQRWVAAGGSAAALIPATLAVRGMARHCPNPLAEPGYYAFDTCAPIVAGTYMAARAAVDVALTAADLLLAGERAVYALCRPPGHHAAADMYGGYCFLNNAAIATEYLLPRLRRAGRPAGRIAMLDIDFHHGNGTQAIFYHRSDVLTISLHADPLHHYPYFSGYADERGVAAGLDYNLNLPLPDSLDDAGFLATLDYALAVVHAFEPAALAISAGFDTYSHDPLGQGFFRLTTPVYHAAGRRLAALGLPLLIVQEGGYAQSALGDNVISFLSGVMVE